MTTPLPELWQFRVAMYPEKIRWVLDHKRVSHIRHSVLPGPHIPKMLRRFSYKATPVFVDGGAIIRGSAAIAQHIEQRWPQPPLVDSGRHAEIEAVQAQFDEWGLAIRRAFFGDFLADSYAADRFSSGFPAGTRRLYRWAFPLSRVLMRRDMAIEPDGVRAGREITQEALDYVAENSAASGFLVGDQFSLADICAATALHVVTIPPEYPAAWPQPYPARLQQWLDHWAAHPGTAWVQRIYRNHRPESAAVEDRNR